MISSHVASAQILSLEVDLVRDLRIGLKPSKAKYMSRADLKVLMRAWFRGDTVEGSVVGDCGMYMCDAVLG